MLKQALVQSRSQGGALVLIVVNSVEKDYYEDPPLILIVLKKVHLKDLSA